MGCGGSKASHEDVAIKVDAAQPEADGKTPATPPAATKNAVIGYKEVVATGAAAQPEAEAEREWPAFSEEQVATLGARVGEALKAAFPDNETAYNEQMVNLHRELAKRGNDRQGHGEVYATVLDYLDGLALEEGIQHGAGEADPAADYDPPDEYPGEEGLGRLWVQVRFLTTADDLPRLEAELTSRSGPEQWSSLIEVRKLLLVGDPEEAAAYARWDPTAAELDAEFEQLMGKVGKEENVSDDYAKVRARELGHPA